MEDSAELTITQHSNCEYQRVEAWKYNSESPVYSQASVPTNALGVRTERSSISAVSPAAGKSQGF